MTDERIGLYRKAYGEWAGNPAGHTPDFTRCCESLYDRYHPGGYQCTRPAKHGPHGAYCKIHDPAAKKARQDKANDRYDAEFNSNRYEWHGKRFFDVLEMIANGHNDARGLAQAVIAEFKKGER